MGSDCQSNKGSNDPPWQLQHRHGRWWGRTWCDRQWERNRGEKNTVSLTMPPPCRCPNLHPPCAPQGGLFPAAQGGKGEGGEGGWIDKTPVDACGEEGGR